jgi:Domain of unknown function (DUF5666)
MFTIRSTSSSGSAGQQRRWAGWFFAAALVAGCGGGGGDTATTSSFARGPITGFGSIIVNGIAFDESSASVTDEEGVSQGRSALKLGMQVEVEGSAIDRPNASAKAMRVRFGSEIVGPAVDINAGAGSFTVLGQKVLVSSTTVFGDGLTGGLAALADKTIVEVHAQFDAATMQFNATRVEAKPTATVFKLRGTVSAFNGDAKTFKIGEAVINFGGIAAADLPSNLGNDLKVRVRLQTAQVNNQWVALAVRAGERRVEDHHEAEVEGLITEFTSNTSFKVNGLVVDATNASFPDGTTDLKLGARVEVEGAVVNGVLVATKVELEDHHANDERHGVELRGLISGLDKPGKTFMLREVKVSYDANTQFKNGTVDTLANDLRVEVKGAVGSDGTTVAAKRIEFKR